MHVWTSALKRLKSFEASGEVLGVAFAPDGKRVASCGKVIEVWKMD